MDYKVKKELRFGKDRLCGQLVGKMKNHKFQHKLAIDRQSEDVYTFKREKQK